MALRNASASAKLASARKRRRVSRTSRASTVTKAIVIAVTKAVSTLGNRSGSVRQLSMRSTTVCPGSSSNCCATNTREPLREVPCTARRVPSASVNDNSRLRNRPGPTSPDKTSDRA